MQVIVKEIENRTGFEPFSCMHLISELRCGIVRLFEKIEHYFNDCDITYYCENEILFNSFLKRENKNNKIKENIPTLLLNSNVLINSFSHKEIKKIIDTEPNNTMILDNKQNIIGYYFNNFDINKMNIDKNNCNKIFIDSFCVINYIWEILDIVGKEIDNDFNNFINVRQIFNNDFGENIFVSKSANVGKGVFFDATAGTIIVDDEATIMPLSFIQGPCYIGKRTIIKAGATIYKNCSFGPYCKAGGEIETTIFQGYSNKQHNGFIGHSFISEWVNIGAGTSNSDLKNNYSNITIQLSNKKVDTGKRFIGAMIGDHSKTAINTSLNTGTIIGICSNVVKTGLTDKYIPPFSWISDKYTEKYDLQKAILTAKVVMNRRHKELTFEEQELITNCYM